MTRLYLVRHCEARGNADRVFHGRTDSDISDKGKEQLLFLCERFSTISLDAIVTSPLKRAVQTAEAVRGDRELPLTTDRDLMEIHVGEWEDKPFRCFPAEFPTLSLCWNMEPWAFSPETGESMAAVYARVSAALMRIAQSHPDQTVAVVSHGCAIRNMLCFAHGWPIERLNDIDWCDNTGVALIEFDGAHMTVCFENDASHLTDIMSTIKHQAWWKKENRDNNEFE